jgi:hypothetical protein
MKEVASRLTKRIQLITDGFHSYLKAVENAFDDEIDFAQLQKMYGGSEGESANEKNIARQNARAAKQKLFLANQMKNLLAFLMLKDRT